MAFRSSTLRRAVILLGLVYVLGCATGAAFAMSPTHSGLLTAFVAILGVVAGACYLAVTSEAVPRGRAALLLTITAVGVVQNFYAPYTGIGLGYVAAWVAPFVVRLPVAAAVVLLSAAATAVVLPGGGVPVATSLGIASGVLLAGAFAATAQQLLVVRQQTDIAAEARAAAAVLAERQRMAREMHDLLAHTLSAQIVHLEGARMLMERGDQPERAQHQVVGALRLARDGLDETKRALAALRGDELCVVDRLAALVAEFRTTGQGRCELEAGTEPVLGTEAGWAIVRTAQEALTNVHKHADGARVVVRLLQSEGWCELQVTDSGGSRGALADTGAGYGLTGMRERAELIGGSLEAGRSGEGFQVRLVVPLGDPAGARP